MAKITKVRIHHFLFNNGNSNIEDVVYEAKDGENLLISLANGGGKSVQIQLLISLFVTDLRKLFTGKKRQFQDLFRNKERPTVAMVDWLIDEKSQRHFIHGCIYRKKEDVLYRRYFYKEYFENQKIEIEDLLLVYKEDQVYYDEQSLSTYLEGKGFHIVYEGNEKAYRNALLQNQISINEWDMVMRKINDKEGGVALYFEEERTQEKLFENRIIPLVNEKLNLHAEMVGQVKRDDAILSLSTTYFEQHYDNLTMLKKLELYERADEWMQEGMSEFTELYIIETLKFENEKKVSMYYYAMEDGLEALQVEKNTLVTTLQVEEHQNLLLQHEVDALQYYQAKDRYEGCQSIVLLKKEEIIELSTIINDCSKEIGISKYQELKKEEEQCHLEIKEYEVKIETSRNGSNLENYDEVRGRYKYVVRREIEELSNEHHEKEQEIKNACKKQDEVREELRNLEHKKISNEVQHKEIQNKLLRARVLEKEIVSYLKEEQIELNLLDDYQDQDLERGRLTLYKDKEGLENKTKKEELRLQTLKEELLYNEEQLQKVREHRILSQKELLETGNKCKEAEVQQTQLLVALEKCGFMNEQLVNKDTILSKLEHRFIEKEVDLKAIQKQIYQIQIHLEQLELPVVSTNFIKILDELELSYQLGSTYLRTYVKDVEKYIKKNPLLPYLLILEEKDIEKLRQYKLKDFVEVPVFIMSGKQFESTLNVTQNWIHLDYISIYANFNLDFFDEQKLKEKRYLLEQEKIKWGEQERSLNEQKNHLVLVIDTLIKYDEKLVLGYYKNMHEIKVSINELLCTEERYTVRVKGIQQEQEQALKWIYDCREEVKQQEELIVQYLLFLEMWKDVRGWIQEEVHLQTIKKEVEQNLLTLSAEVPELRSRIERLEYLLEPLQQQLLLLESELETLKDINESTSRVDETIDTLKIVLQAMKAKAGDLDLLENELKKKYVQVKKIKKEIENIKLEYDIVESDLNKSVDGIEVLREREKQFTLRYKIKVEESKKLEREVIILEERLHQALLVAKRSKEKANLEEIIQKEVLVKKDFILLFKESAIRIEQLQKFIQLCERTHRTITSELQLLEKPRLKKEHSEDIDYYTIVEKSRKQLKLFQQASKDYEERIDLFKSKLTQLLRMFRNDQLMEGFIEQLIDELKKRNVDGIKLQYERIHCLIIETMEIHKATKEQELQAKNSLYQLIKQYLEDVYQQIDIIDKGATYEINGKVEKMLVIEQSPWFEEQIQVNLEQFIDKTTKEYNAIRNKNKEGGFIENPKDMLLKHVNCISLYQTCIGYHQVKVEILKIEQYSVRRLTWKEVSKNSGAETFITSFVLLANLMAYAKRSINQLQRKEESFVMLMDNPFANTTSEHIVKPLFSIAKKMNIQLICFSAVNELQVLEGFPNTCSMVLIDVGNGKINLVDASKEQRIDLVNHNIHYNKVSQSSFDL